jgi:hypothetical protein
MARQILAGQLKLLAVFIDPLGGSQTLFLLKRCEQGPEVARNTLRRTQIGFHKDTFREIT